MSVLGLLQVDVGDRDGVCTGLSAEPNAGQVLAGVDERAAGQQHDDARAGAAARGVTASRERVSASTPSSSTVLMPTPTAASVNATSTASSSTNRLAMTRLNSAASIAAS